MAACQTINQFIQCIRTHCRVFHLILQSKGPMDLQDLLGNWRKARGRELKLWTLGIKEADEIKNVLLQFPESFAIHESTIAAKEISHKNQLKFVPQTKQVMEYLFKQYQELYRYHGHMSGKNIERRHPEMSEAKRRRLEVDPSATRAVPSTSNPYKLPQAWTKKKPKPKPKPQDPRVQSQVAPKVIPLTTYWEWETVPVCPVEKEFPSEIQPDKEDWDNNKWLLATVVEVRQSIKTNEKEFEVRIEARDEASDFNLANRIITVPANKIRIADIKKSGKSLQKSLELEILARGKDVETLTKESAHFYKQSVMRIAEAETFLSPNHEDFKRLQYHRRELLARYRYLKKILEIGLTGPFKHFKSMLTDMQYSREMCDRIQFERQRREALMSQAHVNDQRAKGSKKGKSKTEPVVSVPLEPIVEEDDDGEKLLEMHNSRCPSPQVTTTISTEQKTTVTQTKLKTPSLVPSESFVAPRSALDLEDAPISFFHSGISIAKLPPAPLPKNSDEIAEAAIRAIEVAARKGSTSLDFEH